MGGNIDAVLWIHMHTRRATQTMPCRILSPTRPLTQETDFCLEALDARNAVPRSKGKGQRPLNFCAWSTSDSTEVLRIERLSFSLRFSPAPEKFLFCELNPRALRRGWLR